MQSKQRGSDSSKRDHGGLKSNARPGKHGPQPAFRGGGDENASQTPFQPETDGRNADDRDGNAEHARPTHSKRADRR